MQMLSLLFHLFVVDQRNFLFRSIVIAITLLFRMFFFEPDDGCNTNEHSKNHKRAREELTDDERHSDTSAVSTTSESNTSDSSRGSELVVDCVRFSYDGMMGAAWGPFNTSTFYQIVLPRWEMCRIRPYIEDDVIHCRVFPLMLFTARNIVWSRSIPHHVTSNGIMFYVKIALIKTSINLTTFGCGPQHTGGVTNMVQQCNNWIMTAGLDRAKNLCLTNNAPVKVGNRDVFAPDVAICLPNGRRFPKPTSVIELEVHNRGPQEIKHLLNAYASANDRNNILRLILLVKIYPESRRAYAILWRRNDANTFFVQQALDFGSEELLNRTKAALEEPMPHLPGVPRTDWVRKAPLMATVPATPAEWYTPDNRPLITLSYEDAVRNAELPSTFQPLTERNLELDCGAILWSALKAAL